LECIGFGVPFVVAGLVDSGPALVSAAVGLPRAGAAGVSPQPRHAISPLCRPCSASRIGESDGQINRKRIKAIRQALERKGWASVGF
jgi:hypothetical protein